MPSPDQPFLHFDTLFSGHLHRLVSLGLVVDQLSIAVVAVYGHQDATLRVGNPASTRRPAEATKNLRMDDAKPRTGQHGNGQLRAHSQGQTHPVSSPAPPAIATTHDALFPPDIH